MRHAILDNLYTREANALANGPPLLWLHGLGESGLAFEEAITHPTLASWRHLVPDLLGYGKSAWAESATSIPRHADRIVTWINALNLPRVVLVGHSMGGVVGQLVAERIPSRIAGFLNVEGNITSDDCTFSRRATIYVVDDFVERGMNEVLDDIYRQGAESEIFRRYFASARMCDPRTFHLNGRELVNLSRTGELAQRMGALKTPKKFLAGLPGGTGTSTHAALHAAGVTCHDIERAGHWPFLDRPNAFANTVADFLVESRLAAPEK